MLSDWTALGGLLDADGYDPDLFGDDRLIQHARSVVARAAQVLPPADPEADAATDRFLAQVYAAEGRRPLVRRGPR